MKSARGAQLRKDCEPPRSSAASATEFGRQVLPRLLVLNRRADIRTTRREAHRFRRGCKPATASSRSHSCALREGPPLPGRGFRTAPSIQHRSVRESASRSQQSLRHSGSGGPIRAFARTVASDLLDCSQSRRAAEVESVGVNAAAKTLSRPRIWMASGRCAPPFGETVETSNVSAPGLRAHRQPRKRGRLQTRARPSSRRWMRPASCTEKCGGQSLARPAGPHLNARNRSPLEARIFSVRGRLRISRWQHRL